MDWRRVILRNASANVIRGMATAAVGLVMPPFLTRLLPADKFSAWSLLLQLATYASYLDFGLQTAVSRYVAHASERGDYEKRDRIIASAMVLLAGVGGLVLVATMVMSWQLSNIYPQVPHALVPDFRAALIVIGCSMALGLPMAVFTGVLVGLHRNEFPAIAIGGSRIAIAATIILLARHSDRLLGFAIAMSLWQLAGYAFQAEASRRLLGRLSTSMRKVTRQTVKELAGYCATLSVWNVGVLLVYGLDLILVGYVEFNALGAYSIANTLVMFVAGLNGAVFSAMISPAAALHARHEHEQLGRLVIRSTRLGMYLTALTGLPLIVFGGLILSHWVKAAYAGPALPILQILTAANIIRLTANPYSVAVLGTAQQRLIYISPLVEGLTNLVASIVLGMRFGALGIAAGTLVGSIIGLLWTIFYSVPRTNEVGITLGEYVFSGVLKGFAVLLPVLLATALSGVLPKLAGLVTIAAGLLLTSYLIISRETQLVASPASPPAVRTQ